MSLRALAEDEARAQQEAAAIKNAKRDAAIRVKAGQRVQEVTGFEPTFLDEYLYSVTRWAGDGHVPASKLGIRFQVDDVVLVATAEDGVSWSSVHLECECPTCGVPTITAGGFYGSLQRETPAAEVQSFFIKRLAELMGRPALCGNCTARAANACCPRCKRPWVAD